MNNTVALFLGFITGRVPLDLFGVRLPWIYNVLQMDLSRLGGPDLYAELRRDVSEFLGYYHDGDGVVVVSSLYDYDLLDMGAWGVPAEGCGLTVAPYNKVVSSDFLGVGSSVSFHGVSEWLLEYVTGVRGLLSDRVVWNGYFLDGLAESVGWYTEYMTQMRGELVYESFDRLLSWWDLFLRLGYPPPKLLYLLLRDMVFGTTGLRNSCDSVWKGDFRETKLYEGDVLPVLVATLVATYGSGFYCRGYSWRAGYDRSFVEPKPADMEFSNLVRGGVLRDKSFGDVVEVMRRMCDVVPLLSKDITSLRGMDSVVGSLEDLLFFGLGRLRLMQLFKGDKYGKKYRGYMYEFFGVFSGVRGEELYDFVMSCGDLGSYVSRYL